MRHIVHKLDFFWKLFIGATPPVVPFAMLYGDGNDMLFGDGDTMQYGG